MSKLPIILTGAVLSFNLYAQPYMGIKLGLNETTNSCNLDSTCNSRSFSGSLLLGYDFNHYVSTVYSFDYLGKYKVPLGYQQIDNSGFGDLWSMSFMPKLRLPVTNDLAFYYQLGAAFMVMEHGSELTPTTSLGIEYKLDDRISITSDYQYYAELNDNAIKKMDVNYLSLGLIYRFGASGTSLNSSNKNQT